MEYHVIENHPDSLEIHIIFLVILFERRTRMKVL